MGFHRWTLFSTGKKKEFSQATDIHKESLTVLDFVLTSHFNQKLFFCTKCHFQSCGLGGKRIFIKNSWPQRSDNAAFWYQQMFCLTCSLKLHSVPPYLSFPVAICWLWDVMYVPYSYARQFASNTSARNELHKTLVAITPHFPNHMEHNTLKPIDTFFLLQFRSLKHNLCDV